MTVCPMNYQPPARTGETLPAPKDTDVEPLYLRYVPTSIGRIFTHIRSFKANYGLFPNRIMMSESFASELAYDLCAASSGSIKYSGKPIVKPETFIFNMRVHIVPDEYITIPFEVSCAQELILPFYDHGFIERRARLMQEKFSRYTAIDFQNRFALPER